MKTFNDKVFEVLLGMQRDGLIELDEDDGSFVPVDDDWDWLKILTARCKSAGLKLHDETGN